MAKQTTKREFLQLADKFVQGKHDPSNMFVSEKLDGTRVFWDGGVSRGVPTESVPWANVTDPKTGERKKKILPVASGLWSRYGNPISAPDWWLNQLPQMFLDGELFAGRGRFQTLRSIVAKDVPEDEGWAEVKFAVFGAPTANSLFSAGSINNSNFRKEINPSVVRQFLASRQEAGVMEEFYHCPGMTFVDELHFLMASLPAVESPVYLHTQCRLPGKRSDAEAALERYMDYVLDQGGEGVVLRAPESIWTPKRVKTLLKVKPFSDDNGVLVGFVTGRETDRGSKLRGLIGALILSYQGKRLELSGMTDEERKFESEEQTAWAYNNPGQIAPPDFQGKHFKVGSKIEFRYRELSDDGIPKEARYYRGV
jgi:DNA ligase-1